MTGHAAGHVFGADVDFVRKRSRLDRGCRPLPLLGVACGTRRSADGIRSGVCTGEQRLPFSAARTCVAR
jgi:hypothetical protein